MRLTPPTKTTFSTASLFLIAAVADRYFVDTLGDDTTFVLAVLGGALLWIGAVFNKV